MIVSLNISEPSPSVEIAENVVHDTNTKVVLAPRHTQELAALSIDSCPDIGALLI
jgi:hypothetical protein